MFLVGALCISLAAISGETLPEGPGLAAKYPGDAGIDKDPAVIFVENFESPTIDDVFKRWEDIKEKETLTLVDSPVPNSAGNKSLLQTYVGGKGTGGALYRRMMPGYKQVFTRWYVKFDPECFDIHHFGTNVGGNHPATRWPQVKAGVAPPGDKGFWVGIEPFGSAWVWDYYTYWCDMRGSARGMKYGNTFVRDPNHKVEKGKWICVEFMVKMNDVGDSNGEMALWIDGKRISHLGKGFPDGKWVWDKFTPGAGQPFEGFRWRTIEELNINFVWLYVYITKAPEGHVSKVWFDDVVVAKEYIGPLQKK
jgi:hypothetical protein